MISAVEFACPLCRGTSWQRAFVYRSRPEGETHFAFSDRDDYHREVVSCEVCGHFRSFHSMQPAGFYEGPYVDDTYRDSGVQRAFERIIRLPLEQSDNALRVARIVEHLGPAPGTAVSRRPTVLDVGAGLCVFLHRMKAEGWDGTALDPDARAAAHARDRVGVNAVCADFCQASELGRFDLITFNKVLEHVDDPAGMLRRSGRYLEPGGVVYVEVPDGELAAAEGFHREEFFIDHLHVFSMASFALLGKRAGLDPVRIERIREPSTKYTLFAFFKLR